MARKVRTEEEDAQVDMTPMLDIVFIMLIFFIVTTVFVKEAGIEVALDSVRANLERLLTEQPTDYVFIQADIKAKHGVVVKVMDQVKAAGIDRIAVAARN